MIANSDLIPKGFFTPITYIMMVYLISGTNSEYVTTGLLVQQCIKIRKWYTTSFKKSEVFKPPEVLLIKY